MSNYALYFVPDCLYVTCVTFGRQTLLSGEPVMHLVRSVLGALKRRQPFQMLGYVFLPDHLHLLVKPADNAPFDRIMHGFFNGFEHDYLQMMGLPSGAQMWQRAYRQSKVDDVGEFAARLDYIHYNPVAHGLAARPEEWLHSSYGVWVERNVYKLGWGWQMPEGLIGKRWE